ncbi:MAG: lipopolysaccharide heptosyltransferase family protein [Acidobacteria bacterium]|nr:MAG: lipopolysaccharide heptosyltransferase family protein [Acidobacteriota bacterium]
MAAVRGDAGAPMVSFEAVHKRISRGTRRRLGRVLARCLAAPPAVPPENLPEDPRILVVRLNYRMGNLLLVTPALHALARRWPRARIFVLCGDRYASLLRGNPDVHEIWPLPRPRYGTLGTIVRYLRQLRRTPFDLAIDGGRGGSLTGALAVRLSAAPLTVGGDGTPYAPLFSLRAPPPPAGSHRIEGLLGMLRLVGVEGVDPRMWVHLDRSERRWAAERFAAYGLAGTRVVGLNVGARGDKRWPFDRFLELAGLLRRRPDVRCLLFVGPEEERRFREASGGLPEGIVCDRTFDPRRFAALLERCDVVVSADTGPMHLAAAVGTPVVALFRRDNVEEFRPLGRGHRVLHDPSGPEVEAVRRAVCETLDGPAGAARTE